MSTKGFGLVESMEDLWFFLVHFALAAEDFSHLWWFGKESGFALKVVRGRRESSCVGLTPFGLWRI